MLAEKSKPTEPSRPVRGAWIETVVDYMCSEGRWESRPVRGAWIETQHRKLGYSIVLVAPRAGRVD